MPRKKTSFAATLLSAIATILILILLISGKLAAAPSPRDGDLVFQTSQSRQTIVTPASFAEDGQLSLIDSTF